MKMRTLFECDFCKNLYVFPSEANECEAKHLGLTTDEYEEYMELLQEEKEAFGVAGCATKCAVIEFQKKHGFEDNR